LYSMGIFANEIFLLDFPFNRRKRTCKVCLRFQRCRWHRGNCFSSLNDTAEIVSAVSITTVCPKRRNVCFYTVHLHLVLSWAHISGRKNSELLRVKPLLLYSKKGGWNPGWLGV
jgi:hypothetical protein